MADLAVHPLTWAWLLMLAAGIRALRNRDRFTAAAGLGAAALLSLTGGTPLPDWLLARLEAPYLDSVNQRPARADALVMLGGGHRASPLEVHGLDASPAFDRALATLALAREAGITNIVLGGGQSLRKPGQPGDGPALARWLEPLVPAGTRIRPLPSSRTTREEFLHFVELARREHWNRIVLVTSAAHLPRALPLFRSTGMEVQPAACDFSATAALREGSGWSVIPRASTLYTMHTAAHEIVGGWWYRGRGWDRPQSGPE